MSDQLPVRLRWSLPISLGLGLALGSLLFRTPSAVDGQPAPAAAQSSAKDLESPSAPAASTQTEVKTLRLTAAALRPGPAFERDNDLYVAITAFDADDFRRLLADATALKELARKLDGVDRDLMESVTRGLVQRWLAVDAPAAVAALPRILELIPRGQHQLEYILGVFAEKRPEEVLALYASHPEAADRALIISAGLKELAAQQPAKARTWLGQVTDPAEKAAAEKAVRAGTVQADPLRIAEYAKTVADRDELNSLAQAATARAERMGSGVLRELAASPLPLWMLARATRALADRDPELAVEVAIKAGTDGSGLSYGLQNAFQILGGRDHESALARLNDLTGAQRNIAIAAIGAGWGEEDPPAALAWLMTCPRDERVTQNGSRYSSNDALAMTFSDWLEREPASARAWADAQPRGETRDLLQTQLARVLAARGQPEEAIQVLTTLGTAEPRVIADLARAWAGTDPQSAARWAVALPEGPLQTRALSSLVSRWADDDPQAVTDWLTQFPAGPLRDRSVSAYVRRDSGWMNGTDAQLAESEAWLGSMQDPWERARVAQQAYWLRRSRDPAGARAWLASLPNVDASLVRSTLAAP